jgi:hypothetical protein
MAEMKRFDEVTTELVPGQAVRLEVFAIYEYTASYVHCFKLENGQRFCLPTWQKYNDRPMWQGEAL